AAVKLADLRIRHSYLHDDDCPSSVWGDDDCCCSGENGRLSNEAEPDEAVRILAASWRNERDRAEAAEAERDKELAARREVEAEREASDVHADRLLAERDEALARLDRPSPAIEELAAERDELQARIECVRHL